MARPKFARPTARKVIRIDAEVLANVELQLYSEINQAVPYGVLNSLIENLLVDWLKKRKTAPLEMRKSAQAKAVQAAQAILNAKTQTQGNSNV